MRYLLYCALLLLSSPAWADDPPPLGETRWIGSSWFQSLGRDEAGHVRGLEVDVSCREGVVSDLGYGRGRVIGKDVGQGQLLHHVLGGIPISAGSLYPMMPSDLDDVILGNLPAQGFVQQTRDVLVPELTGILGDRWRRRAYHGGEQK